MEVTHERNNLSSRNHLDHDRHWRDVGLERLIMSGMTAYQELIVRSQVAQAICEANEKGIWYKLIWEKPNV